jgi:hypothetical protein
MDLYTLTIILLATGLIHGSFQLSLSVLTLLSGHTLGAKRSRRALVRLSAAFVLGAFVITALLSASSTFLADSLFAYGTPELVWVMTLGLAIGVAVANLLFYYRKSQGTEIWLPRGMADYLLARVKATRSSAESFTLGVSSVLAEMLFVVAPLALSALALLELQNDWRPIGVLTYGFVATMPLLVVLVLINRGYSLGRIQKWRVENKIFLQFTASAGLILLSLFLYVNHISDNMTKI